MNTSNRGLSFFFIVLSCIFVAYTAWWGVLNVFFTPDDNLNNYFTDSYGIIACIGGLIGLVVARRWGMFKSIFGRALSMISIGLFFQFLGQVSYAIYYYVYHIDNPYPSFGEIFYFGSIPIYIYGVWLLGKAVGVKYSLKEMFKNPLSLVIPAILLCFAYIVFLKDYESDPTAPLTTFLDLGYPFGQALFVSLAAFVFVNSKRFLGGVMKKYIVFVMYALIFQYIADTLFLYNTINETWRAGGTDDMLYVLSYFWMSLALYRFSDAATKISEQTVNIGGNQ